MHSQCAEEAPCSDHAQEHNDFGSRRIAKAARHVDGSGPRNLQIIMESRASLNTLTEGMYGWHINQKRLESRN